MTEPSYSIIVPSMGRPDLLGCLLDGIAHTIFPPAVEVCIGLDPSGEGFPRTVTGAGLHVNWRLAPTPGMSTAVNAAFSLASNDWIVVMPDDAVPQPGWLDLRFDGPAEFMSPGRVLCFELLEPGFGSFPPPVDAGHDPTTFDAKVARAAAFARLLTCMRRAVPGRFFVGACVLHRSKWVPWPEWCDPYSANDISWIWETHLTHPDLAFGGLPGNCVYHFQRGSVKAFGIEAPPETAQLFRSHYGLTIAEAYQKINDRSVALWEQSL